MTLRLNGHRSLGSELTATFREGTQVDDVLKDHQKVADLSPLRGGWARGVSDGMDG